MLKPTPLDKTILHPDDEQEYIEYIDGLGDNTKFDVARMVGHAVQYLLQSVPQEKQPDKTALEYSPWDLKE